MKKSDEKWGHVIPRLKEILVIYSTKIIFLKFRKLVLELLVFKFGTKNVVIPPVYVRLLKAMFFGKRN